MIDVNVVKKIKQKLDQPVTGSMLFKFLICLNIIVLAFCIRIANVRTTQDEETLEYINYLEEIVEKDNEYRKVLWDYINYLKEH